MVRAHELGAAQRRAVALLALLSLCLLGLTGPAQSVSSALSTSRGDTVLIATHSHAAVAARTLADRLSPHALGQRHLAPTGSLPAAVLGALLLAATVVRRRNTGTPRQAGLLAAAGRGPPLTS